MKKRIFKRIISLIIIACIVIGGLWFAQALLMPKYTDDIIEGRLIEEYYDNAGGNDVIFIGDCEVYENIFPITLWEEYGIEFVLMNAPSIYPYWYDEWNEQIEAYAQEYDLLYINFLDYVDEIGINYSTDTYDNGLHLNVDGAEKLASYFGAILQEEFDLTDHRDEEDTAELWQEKVDFYYEMKGAVRPARGPYIPCR